MNDLNCRESRLDDIVRIDIYPASQCSIPVPPTISIQSLVENNFFSGTPALSVALSVSEETEGEMTDSPTLKVSTGRQQAGTVYKHDLQIPLKNDKTLAERAVDALQGHDFHCVYTHADGARDMSYALPNASTIDIDEQLSSNSSVIVKVKVASMSHPVILTAS